MNIPYIRGKGDGYWGRPYNNADLNKEDEEEYAKGFNIGLDHRIQEGKNEGEK